MTAREAIQESIRTNAIVHAQFDPTINYELLVRSEDDAEYPDRVEYWGVDDSDGSHWRVCLHWSL
jgi:hypothetical protein